MTVTSNAYAFVPTAFSPNGDGHNDILLPQTAGLVLREFAVYNRAGQRVFQTNGYNQGWDGRVGGAEAPVSTYFWMLRSVDEAGGDYSKGGNVTLVR